MSPFGIPPPRPIERRLPAKSDGNPAAQVTVMTRAVTAFKQESLRNLPVLIENRSQIRSLQATC